MLGQFLFSDFDDQLLSDTITLHIPLNLCRLKVFVSFNDCGNVLLFGLTPSFLYSHRCLHTVFLKLMKLMPAYKAPCYGLDLDYCLKLIFELMSCLKFDQQLLLSQSFCIVSIGLYAILFIVVMYQGPLINCSLKLLP